MTWKYWLVNKVEKQINKTEQQIRSMKQWIKNGRKCIKRFEKSRQNLLDQLDIVEFMEFAAKHGYMPNQLKGKKNG